MTFMLPDGRALDDAEPQDMARCFGDLFESVAKLLDRDEPLSDEGRAQCAKEMYRAAMAARLWAEFGKWAKPSIAPMSSLKKYRDEPTGLEEDTDD